MLESSWGLILSILGSSLFGGILGAFLEGYINRNTAKKEPKTDRRAEAYKDFTVYFVVAQTLKDNEKIDTQPCNLNEIKARLAVFGETEVINAAAKFLELPNESKNRKKAFCEVIKAMRESVQTGARDEVMNSIETLLPELNPKPNL